MQSHARIGISLVLAAACLWGTTGTAQALSGASLPASWFGALRLAVAALFFGCFAWGMRSSRHGGRLSLNPGFLVAGLCMAAYNLSFFAGIRLTGIALGTALALGSGPLWAGLLQAVLLKRLPPASWWGGTALAVLGGALMAGVGGGQQASIDLTGVVLCLAAGLSYAIYALVTQRLGKITPALLVTRNAFTIAAILALPFAWFDAGRPVLSGGDVAAVLYVGIVTAGVAYWLFSLALQRISVATGVTLSLFEPVVACVLAAFLIGEPVSGLAWLGLGLALAGVLAVMRSEMRAQGRSTKEIGKTMEAQ